MTLLRLEAFSKLLSPDGFLFVSQHQIRVDWFIYFATIWSTGCIGCHQGADKESDQMAGMVPSQHSFNHYIWELEQVGDLDRQYWQTITSVIPTGGERLLFNKTVEYNKRAAMNRSKS